MFSGPVRGGTRGGAAEFKWDDVKADKDRENYLGHSVMAAAGRWQKNKDIHWYARDQETSEDAAARARADEIRKVKEAEEDALAVALGFEPAVRMTDEERELERLAKEREKADKAARKAERHAEKQVKKEIKEQLKAERRLARADESSTSGKRHRSRDESGSSKGKGREDIGRRSPPPPSRHDRERERSPASGRRNRRQEDDHWRTKLDREEADVRRDPSKRDREWDRDDRRSERRG